MGFIFSLEIFLFFSPFSICPRTPDQPAFPDVAIFCIKGCCAPQMGNLGGYLAGVLSKRKVPRAYS